jgi:uncharacterized protein YdhG (YjbR/CyaY superfamily)
MPMPKAKNVDEYLSRASPPHRALLESLRATIKAAAPEAQETIDYGMPSFRLDGRLLVSYSDFKRHVSLFPASGMVVEALGAELKQYFHPKATLRFREDQPIPVDLVRKVVEVRLKEFGAG